MDGVESHTFFNANYYCFKSFVSPLCFQSSRSFSTNNFNEYVNIIIHSKIVRYLYYDLPPTPYNNLLIFGFFSS